MPFLLILALAVVILLASTRTALGYVKGLPLDIPVAPIGDGFELRSDAAASFLQMRAAAARNGVPLKVTSAFRTHEDQLRLYDLFVNASGNLAAKPGYSNHQSGVAVDIAVDGTFTSKTYLWLAANAVRFNFINTGRTFPQAEPWHWEYRK